MYDHTTGPSIPTCTCSPLNTIRKDISEIIIIMQILQAEMILEEFHAQFNVPVLLHNIIYDGQA